MTEKNIEITVQNINNARKMNKNNWYTYIDKIDGLKVKGFKTWIQIIEMNGFRDGSPMGLSVKEYKEWLTNWLTEISKHSVPMTCSQSENL